MSDEEAIRNLIATYCQTVDDGRFDEWEQIWTDDATFRVLDQSHEGRAALRAFIEIAQAPERRGKHVTVNSVLHVDGDTARGSSDFLFLAPTEDGPKITQIGRYTDTFVRTADGWRIRSRDISLGF